MREKVEILSQIQFLRKELHYHNHKYYIENSPEISDENFDKMLSELQHLERENPDMYDPNSPTERVGSDINLSFNQIEHKYPMLSLSNTYSEAEIMEFDNRIRKEEITPEYVAELKFDGTAISLIYEKGKLLYAITRGDGTRGDDVTSNCKTIKSIPLVLEGGDYPDYFEVRGEIYMPHKSFLRLNIERDDIGETPFANPRNAAAGTLKLQNSKEVARRVLDSTIYGFYADVTPFSTHYETLLKLSSWGFKVSKDVKVCRSVHDLQEYISYWDKNRSTLEYDTDGIVIKLNSLSDQQLMGYTAKAPRWAVAYKFKAETAYSIVESIDYQVGRTGAITPVANLTPVLLAGTVVKRASLHNAAQIDLLGIRLGDTVSVEKGGEIIPKITGVDLTKRDLFVSEKIEYITKCPACGTPLIRESSEAKHYCPNTRGCPPQIAGRIVHFVSRKAMNIDGLGEETIELMCKEGLLKDISDIFSINKEQISRLERMGEKSADNIMSAIDTSKNVPFERVLFALGIRFVGETTAKKLARSLKNIETIRHSTVEELVAVDEVGVKIAESIRSYFDDEYNNEIVNKLINAGLIFEIEQSILSSESLKDKVIVVSGAFKNFSRDQLKAIIESHSGKVVSSISKKCSYIVAGDNMGPTKAEKAAKLGIKIVSEEEFIDILNGL